MTIAFIDDPSLCPVQPMNIIVDDKGMTKRGSGAQNAQVCLKSDPQAFFSFYLKRLAHDSFESRPSTQAPRRSVAPLDGRGDPS